MTFGDLTFGEPTSRGEGGAKSALTVVRPEPRGGLVALHEGQLGVAHREPGDGLDFLRDRHHPTKIVRVQRLVIDVLADARSHQTVDVVIKPGRARVQLAVRDGKPRPRHHAHLAPQRADEGALLGRHEVVHQRDVWGGGDSRDEVIAPPLHPGRECAAAVLCRRGFESLARRDDERRGFEEPSHPLRHDEVVEHLLAVAPHQRPHAGPDRDCAERQRHREAQAEPADGSSRPRSSRPTSATEQPRPPHLDPTRACRARRHRAPEWVRDRCVVTRHHSRNVGCYRRSRHRESSVRDRPGRSLPRAPTTGESPRDGHVDGGGEGEDREAVRARVQVGARAPPSAPPPARVLRHARFKNRQLGCPNLFPRPSSLL